MMNDPAALALRLSRLDEATAHLANTRPFARATRIPRVLDAIKQVLLQHNGLEHIRARVPALDAAGVFVGSDWNSPQILQARLTPGTLASGNTALIILEILSELRFLAIAQQQMPHAEISADRAKTFLEQVLAANLKRLLSPPNEAERTSNAALASVTRELLRLLADELGLDGVIDHVVDESWRILQQRPIQVEHIKTLITGIAQHRNTSGTEFAGSPYGLDRLISALRGTTVACRDEPDYATYQERLRSMDQTALQYEASGFARAMHDTGLVSPYHAIVLRHLLSDHDHLLEEALGLSSTGRDALLCYRPLCRELIECAIHVESAQAIYGLALLLERGVLYQPPVAPALWRQLSLKLCAGAEQRLLACYGDTPKPSARLLSGVLSVLGQPLGIGQGNNPTCQSARALSMWAHNDPDYLLQMVAWAARDDEIIMHFEGQPISSREIEPGLTPVSVDDLDPVSLLVVPHLDRIYLEMGRRCADRGHDPHQWINPEFHGWWVGRGFAIAVDIQTGKLMETDNFLRLFYACFHPYYNGNQPLVHPQPAGIAVTDGSARFVGWHAITIQRVALDPAGAMRVYFYNPNNDSGQDWGAGVVVSTSGNGERFGEASLPFEQFAARLYIFHYDPLEYGEPANVEQSLLTAVTENIQSSWGAER